MELGVQGVQLHTHFLTLSLGKDQNFPKRMACYTKLHTQILGASAVPEYVCENLLNIQ